MNFPSLEELIPELRLAAYHRLPLELQLRMLPVMFSRTYVPIVDAMFALSNVDDKMYKDLSNLKSCFQKCEATLTKSIQGVLIKPALAAVIAGLPVPEVTIDQRLQELEAEMLSLRNRLLR